MGKFNILSVNVILFQGNQKTIRVGLSGQNNADSGLFTKQIRAISGLSGRLKAQFLVTHGCFPKSQLFLKSTLNLARFDTKFGAVRKILLMALWQGSLGCSV